MRVQGFRFLAKAVPMNWFSYLYSGAGLIAGIFAFGVAGSQKGTAEKTAKIETAVINEA